MVTSNSNKKKGAIAIGALLLLLWWRKGATATVDVGFGGTISQHFTPFDVVQSNIAEEYNIEEQYDPPSNVFKNAQTLATQILEPVFFWWTSPEWGDVDPARVQMQVNSWWRSDQLIEKMIELANAGAPGIYSPSPTTTHRTGGTADVDFYLDGENRNDLFIRGLLAINAPFDQIVIEHGSISRPNVVHVEYNPNRSLADQRRQVARIDSDGNYIEKSLEWAQETYL